jgi:type II secretory pathway component PulF
MNSAGVENTDPSPPTSSQIFRFRAIELATGRVHTGERRANSAYEVRSGLRRVGLEVERLEQLNAGSSSEWLTPLRDAWNARQRRRRRVARADLCEAIATLLQAGVTLEQALSSLAAAPSRTTAEQRMLTMLRDRLREGVSLSDACAQAPEWFDRFDIAILSAGQRSSDLAPTLQSLAQFHQRAGEIAQKLLMALAYPGVLFLAGIGVVEFMSLNTLPQLLSLITQARKEPPWLTVKLVAFGQGLAHWWPVVILGLIGGFVLMRALLARVPTKGRLGRWVHGNPIARARIRIRVAGLALSLARLRRAGLPLAEGLAVAAQTVQERALRKMLTEAVEAIRRGEDLSNIVAASPLLDAEFAYLLQVGERSGELTEVLERIAERYRHAADRSSDRVAAILGPAAIVILACLIGVVVIACVTPLTRLGDLI